MPKRLKLLTRLEDEQQLASSPKTHAALSASAGTGKTHVLTARVLRLLLSGVDPSSILCLTFTKAGAAEMADRIHARLAYWVRLKDQNLKKELFALGEGNGPEEVANARRLFARVLDASGGGLRIMTIHAFSQGLLAAFPAEAGLVPGFRPLEGREEQQLARSTLADLLVRAEAAGDHDLVADMQVLSHRLGEGGAESFLMCCARDASAMAALPAREGIEALLRRTFALPEGDIDAAIEAECCDSVFDVAGLTRIGILNGQWATKGGLERASLCEQWTSAAKPERAHMLEQLHTVWAKADGELRSFGKGQAPQDPDYVHLATRAFECCDRLLRMRKLAAVVTQFAAALRAGQAFAAAYIEAKRAHGAVDFDDLIAGAERLLTTPGMGDWVRYKLDQSTDHILVDEAQDTNERQWSIVSALTEEFFAGEGAVGRHRTIFTVGDFKQAIFRFQGTNPREFDRARDYFSAAARQLREDALQMRIAEDALPPAFLDLSMDRSFRSSPPILQLVDRVVADLGHEALGLPRRPNPHLSHHSKRHGSVTLWQPWTEGAPQEEEAGEEGWISDTTRRYATCLAKQIKRWIAEPFTLGEGAKKRPIRAEDILILVRRRGALAALLVARLHAEGVPVAGVDRLLLSAPLAVQDLLAVARFAVQPLDDLNLASLLVSPLFNWSQDQLFAAAHGRERAPLWPRLRDGAADPATLQALQSILVMADYTTPHQFIETILSGPMDGRRKLLERLGPEARDPIEELLASALEFESNATPSLQPFLDWFARGEVEIVRDPSAPLDAVRVMTVHGSKGLQSPVVILADACVDPSRARGGTADLTLPDGNVVPLFRPRKDELAEPFKSQIEEQDRLDREEHWRLLYVAMTRAEERLYVGGALGPGDKSGPPRESWYAACQASMEGLGCEWQGDAHWGQSCRFGDPELPARAIAEKREARLSTPPAWLREPAPVEARPPRPLAPSGTGEDDVANPPPTPEMRAAAERGRLLHQLFERLPGVAPADRAELADSWLERSAGVSGVEVRRRLVADACGIISDPRYADLFGPDALAEAPIAAVTPDGSVIAGTADRLLVTPARVHVIDFKTGRAVPATSADTPTAHLRQMAHYVAALEVIFPDRAVDAALLYTSGPVLHPLTAELLAPYRPAG
ncbi:MAG TPA: double-strand break repair helicase AddA [Allosphingosinicella sp.]|uniref:double-strand break repair helicase AddA n=1 Tax=Allosphingosinicella sp. TaxID=2823234 RepID=UPI002F27E9FE